jgi:membrane-associated phospholipid phosphatase
VFAYNAVLGAVWLFALSAEWYAPWLLLAHVAGLGLLFLLSRLRDPLGTGMRLVRELYPLLFVAGFWVELDLVRPALGLVGIDKQIAGLDLLVFRVHLHEIWLPSMGALWFSEAMHFLYYLYYPSIFVPAIALAILGRETAIRDMTYRLVVTYFVCFLIYIAFPVDGPHFLEPQTLGAYQEGFFYGLVDAAQRLGDSRGCSFPSSHVAGAVTIAYLAWRWLPRWAALLLTVDAAGVLASTVYTQNHYAIDSVAGLGWALLFNFVLAAPLKRLLTASRPELENAVMEPGSAS